jgi:hypothetical protein
MAVMEAVIGLEIALARYLNTYLQERRGLSAARVKSFINPQLGLTDRVAVDKWFDPGNDLFIRFERFPSQLVADWHHGKVHLA